MDLRTGASPAAFSVEPVAGIRGVRDIDTAPMSDRLPRRRFRQVDAIADAALGTQPGAATRLARWPASTGEGSPPLTDQWDRSARRSHYLVLYVPHS